MKKVLFWAGVVLSATLLIFSLRGLKLDEFSSSLRQANLVWLVPGIAAYFVAVTLRAWRWQRLLQPVGDIPLSRLFTIVVIGYMGNNIYPARIGELVRAYVLKRSRGVSIATSLSTVFIERLVDAIVMASFVFIGLPRVPNLPDWVRQSVLVGSGFFAVATVIVLTLAMAPSLTHGVANALAARLLPLRMRAPALGFVEQFVQGAAGLRSPTNLLAIVVGSVFIWLTETAKYWCIAQGFGLSLGFVDLMLVNGVSNLFTIIPGPPGAVGTFDAGSILTLEALGVSQALASAYTVVLHVALWLPVTALGLTFFLREGLHWSDLRNAREVT